MEKTNPLPAPPRAAKYPQELEFHGDKRIDPYYWLKDAKHVETIPYLKAENEYTEKFFAPLKSTEEALFEELKSRIVKDDTSPPAKSDDYFYYRRTEGDKEQAIHCRKKQLPGASLQVQDIEGSLGAEEILLDCNALAAGHKSFSLGVFDVSPKHDILAYAVDTNGSEIYTLLFKDLKSGLLLADRIESAHTSSAWCKDNETFYYVTQDANQRPDKVWRHRLGTLPSMDDLIFEEKDSQYFISCGLSESEEYIFVNRKSHASSEIYFLEANDPAAKLKLFAKLEEGIEYDVSHAGSFFYVLTNKNAQTFQLCRCPLNATSSENWETVIPALPSRTLTGIQTFKNFAVVLATEQALEKVYRFDYPTNQLHALEFPDPIYEVGLGANLEFDTNWVRLNYNSMVQPNQTYDLDLITFEKIVRKVQKIPSGYNADDYTSERIWATSKDGVQVPISLVYKKSLRKPGQSQPTLLYGYGSYGIAMPTSFSTSRISLMDRGYIYAIAHIRGGSDMGRQWYETGKFLTKKRTFEDFIACAEHMIHNKYSESKSLAIMGGSAGGMLMGAVINMRPELFNCALAIVPFVDVLNTMLDSSLPLTQMEYQEWGNPEASKEYYDYIKSYSPYDNVEAKQYPHLYIKAGLHDPRVTYWEPAKWCAKLREMKTDSNILLLETDMESGHAGASGRLAYLKEIARQFTFILAANKV